MTRTDLPGETWRDIPGWEGRYSVSDIGRVFSCPKPGVWKSGRVMSPHPAKAGGYPVVALSRGGERLVRTVHTLVMLAFVGPRPPGLEVRHLDGNPANNHLENLRYGTHSENVRDSVRQGTHPATRKTHCKNGHPFNEENTYWRNRRRDSRDCRACQRMRRERKRLACHHRPDEGEAA